MQEHGTERGTEVRYKVRHDEHTCAHCEGTHAYRRNRQVYQMAVKITLQFAATAKSVRQSVSLGR